MGFRSRGSSAASAERATGLNSGSVDTVLSGDAFVTQRRLVGPREELSFLFNNGRASEMGLPLDKRAPVAERLTSSAVRCALDAP